MYKQLKKFCGFVKSKFCIISALLFQVVHPHHRFTRMTKRQAAFVLVLVWLLVISPWVPILAYNHIKGSGNNTQCFFFTPHKEAPRATILLVAMHRILMVLEFIFPLGMPLFCSIRISSFLKAHQMGKPEKVHKAMRVCATIVVVFTMCFLPSTVTTIGEWVIRSYRRWDCAAFYTIVKLSHESYGRNFLNSALDPHCLRLLQLHVQEGPVGRVALRHALRTEDEHASVDQPGGAETHEGQWRLHHRSLSECSTVCRS